MTFLESSIADIALFISVATAKDQMPNVTVDSAVIRFRKLFGDLCEDCTNEQLAARYYRMDERHRTSLRTPGK